MVLKTREKLIEVARQLFAHKGVGNTTMNDIAAASDKGRRTIYTYFKNKREIYNAVIERESDQLVSRLRDVANTNMRPTEKLRLFLCHRFDHIAPLTQRHEVSLSIFGRDLKRVERIRQLAMSKVFAILDTILSEGIKAGEFDPEQAKILPLTLSCMIQGMDYISSKTPLDDTTTLQDTRRNAIEFIINGLKTNNPNKDTSV